MTKTKAIIFLSVVSLIAASAQISETKAEATKLVVHNTDNKHVEAIEVTKKLLISDDVDWTNSRFKEASHTLFPVTSKTRKTLSSNLENETASAMLSTDAQYMIRTQNLPHGAGQVYFYCQISTSGWFRGIQKIIDVGYKSARLVFKGQLQYHLADPNKIHYTLNGELYSNTTYTVAEGESVRIGDTGNMTVSVSETSNYVSNLLHHEDIGY